MSRLTSRVVAAVCVIGLALTFPSGARAQDHRVLFRQYRAAVLASQYRQAEQLALQGLALARSQRHDGLIAAWSNNLGVLYMGQERFAEAEPLFRLAYANDSRLMGAADGETIKVLGLIGWCLRKQAKYDEAEPILKQALALKQRTKGPESHEAAMALSELADLYCEVGKTTEAEALYKQSIAIDLRANSRAGAAQTLQHLGAVYFAQGRFDEAESLFRQNLAISEKENGPNHSDVAQALPNLASVCALRGRHAEAETMLLRALGIMQAIHGAESPVLAKFYNNLGVNYEQDLRLAEAEAAYRKSLELAEKGLGLEHPDLIAPIRNLGNVYLRRGGYPEAEAMFRRSLAISRKSLPAGNSAEGRALLNIGQVYAEQGRAAEAETTYRDALALLEKSVGSNHPQTARVLSMLARLYWGQDRVDESRQATERALAIQKRTGSDPDYQFNNTLIHAQTTWRSGRRAEAVAELRADLELAERQRGQAAGGDRERAGAFLWYADGYELMVGWQSELGDMAEAFSAIERSRTRSFLDSLSLAGADLDLGRPAAERDALREEDGRLRSKVAELQNQLARLGPQDVDKARALEAELETALDGLYVHDRDALATSPVYRGLVSGKTSLPTLAQVQRGLVGENGLLLVYLFGRHGGYVMVIGRESARLSRLALSNDDAKRLGIAAGPLTAARLETVILGGAAPGVVPLVSQSAADPPVARLEALWRILVPEAERKAIVAGKVDRLLVVADGALSYLPLEALVVEDGPKYLLDVGPPVLYGPSSSVLMRLEERPAAVPSRQREPVLTIADPAYPPAPAAPDRNVPRGGAGGQNPGARYAVAGGSLARLPFTALESQWLAKAFGDAGLKVGVLTADKATEAAVRYWGPGRRILHLACHGLTDETYGNFYGSLALAPGPAQGTANLADDGFLTLEELNTLDLKGTELTILSACETNYGPQQTGEGVWALSRGFLVAGSRRVVASNWLVDDEAAAGIVSVLSSRIAEAEKRGDAPDYARALQSAKRWARQQPKWSKPYYWASLVLVGPP